MRVVLASGNRGKAAELARWSQDIVHCIEIVSAHEFDGAVELLARTDEDGATYEENALIKALAVANFTGLPAIADDSGLEVDALGGGPGIRSARAAPGSDADRVQWLLGELDGVEDDRRCARFAACIVIAFPGEDGWFSSIGTCDGRIAESPRGIAGFGYDPIFIPRGMSETFAELGSDVKDRISHRASALDGMAKMIGAVVKYHSLL